VERVHFESQVEMIKVFILNLVSLFDQQVGSSIKEDNEMTLKDLPCSIP
jgi:hypothetical protein